MRMRKTKRRRRDNLGNEKKKKKTKKSKGQLLLFFWKKNWINDPNYQRAKEKGRGMEKGMGRARFPHESSEMTSVKK